MYETEDDPYCYQGTTLLKNRLGLRSQADLDSFIALVTAQRADEPLPLGTLDMGAYRGLHRHFFQDVFDWAGEFRSVRIAKGGSMFCYPEHIGREMERLLKYLADSRELTGVRADEFAVSAARFVSELNAIHPFREGNGRTQNISLTVLADRAGYPLDWGRLEPADMLDAMIRSFSGDERPLARLIRSLMVTSRT
jgi:cell filamentation protein